MRDQVDEEGDQDGDQNAGLQGKLDAVVDHRREDDEENEREHRQKRVVHGARAFEGLLEVLLVGLDGSAVGDAAGSVALVEPALDKEVADGDRGDHADGNGNLALDEVGDDVGRHQVGGTHGVRGRGTEVKAAGRADHGGGRGAGDAERDEERIDAGHQKKTEAHGGVDEERHELAHHVGDGEQHVRGADGGKRLDAELHERLGGADAVHVEGEARDEHDVEAEAGKAALHLVREGLNEVEAHEVRALLRVDGIDAHEPGAHEHEQACEKKDDGRVVVLEHAVRHDGDDCDGNEDAEHFFWFISEVRGTRP